MAIPTLLYFPTSTVSLPPIQGSTLSPPHLKPAPDPSTLKVRNDACILVIDDDPNILLTVRSILEFEGYRVETAVNGAEGLAKATQLQPNLILLDMRMPVLDGWGFADRLKEAGLQVPVVVITAARDASRWAEEIGAVGHLDKPFDLLDLLAVVERWCPNS